MATVLEQQRLRLDVGLSATDTASLSDAAIDALFVEMGELYTDAASIHAGTRILYISRLLMQAASEVDYTQNNTTEKASQRYTHLKELLAEWKDKLATAVSGTLGGAARFGRTTRKPARIKEHPNTGGWAW